MQLTFEMFTFHTLCTYYLLLDHVCIIHRIHLAESAKRMYNIMARELAIYRCICTANFTSVRTLRANVRIKNIHVKSLRKTLR